MTRTSRIILLASLLAAAGLVGAIALPPWRTSVVAVAALLAFLLGGIEMAAASLRQARESSFDRALAEGSEHPERPKELQRFERVLGWPSHSARDFEAWVRPMLRSLLKDRLLARRGIDIDTHPAAARAVLPPELQALLGPHVRHAAPAEGRDVDSATVGRLLDGIEAIYP